MCTFLVVECWGGCWRRVEQNVGCVLARTTGNGACEHAPYIMARRLREHRMTLQIQITRDPADIRACMQLRRVVFVEEQGVPHDIEFDGEDDACTHVIVKTDGRPVGTARFHIPGDYAKIQRVCISSDHRGLGIGAALIRFIVEHVEKTEAVTSVRLGAQVSALDFYRKLGFTEYGEEYLDANIRHLNMERFLICD